MPAASTTSSEATHLPPPASCPHSTYASDIYSPACKLAMASCTEDVEMSASKATSRSVAGRAGRRQVLAELSGNESPIIGLIPGLHNCAAARTPCCDFKSLLGSTKKPLIPPTADDSSNSTPVGENLLRSQVNVLLQKVESDAPAIHKLAPSLRAAICHLYNFIDSPALRLVAPTPVNTPCSCISSILEPAPSSVSSPDSQVVAKLLNSTLDTARNNEKLLVQSSRQEVEQEADQVLKVQDSGIKLLVDLHTSPELEAVPSYECPPVLSEPSEESGPITITESVLSGRDHHIMLVTPLISEAYTLGKKTTRTLHFDSPDKALAAAMACSSMTSPAVSSARELEEEEDVSEWSVLVNVSSPDQSQLDVHEATVYEEDSADSSDLSAASPNNLYVNQKDTVCSTRRRGTPFPKGTSFTVEDDDEEVEEHVKSDTEIECSELEYAGGSYINLAGDKEEAWVSKGTLRRAEGKHIRFSYESESEI